MGVGGGMVFEMEPADRETLEVDASKEHPPGGRAKSHPALGSAGRAG
jgi:hypothetical protein